MKNYNNKNIVFVVLLCVDLILIGVLSNINSFSRDNSIVEKQSSFVATGDATNAVSESEVSESLPSLSAEAALDSTTDILNNSTEEVALNDISDENDLFAATGEFLEDDSDYARKGDISDIVTADVDDESIPEEIFDEVTADDTESISDDETSDINDNEQNSNEAENNVSSNSVTYNGEHQIVVVDGVTYIDGILIVNKSYSLPSTYNPGGILPEVSAAFAEMQRAAAAEGLRIYMSSGFRSYNRQVSLYNYYIRRDGLEKADTFSARPGYSEHQSGMCIDLNSITEAFNNTAECEWVANHAHEYGFIIRFPEGKEDITGYKYESWHIRFVGVEAATEMYNTGQCLEEYLDITSVYPE